MQQVLEIQNIQILSLLSPRAFIIATAPCESDRDPTLKDLSVLEVRSQKSHVEFGFSFLVSCGICSQSARWHSASGAEGGEQMPGSANRF